MIKAYCQELKEYFVIGLDLPENFKEYTWFCPHCNYRVEYVTTWNGKPCAPQWKHVIHNAKCPMIQKQRWDR